MPSDLYPYCNMKGCSNPSFHDDHMYCPKHEKEFENCVLIEVSGGVARVARCPEGVKVIINTF